MDNNSKDTRRNISNSSQGEIEYLISYLMQSKDTPSAPDIPVKNDLGNSAGSANSVMPKSAEKTVSNDVKPDTSAQPVQNSHPSSQNIQKEQRTDEGAATSKSKPAAPAQAVPNTHPSVQNVQKNQKDKNPAKGAKPSNTRPAAPAKPVSNTHPSVQNTQNMQKVQRPAERDSVADFKQKGTVQTVSNTQPSEQKSEAPAQISGTQSDTQKPSENTNSAHTEPVVSVNPNNEDSEKSADVDINGPKKLNFVFGMPTDDKTNDDKAENSEPDEIKDELVDDKELSLDEQYEDIDSDNRPNNVNQSLYPVQDQPIEMHLPVFISLSELLIYVLKNIYIIILTVIIGGSGMYIVSSKISSPQYTSTSKIIIFITEEEDESSASWNDLQFNFSVMTDCTQIVTSRDVLENVIKDLELNTDYNALVKNIHVSVMQNSRIMEISVTYEDPIIAMNILKNLRQTAFDAIQVALEVDHYKIIQYENLPHSPSENNTKQHIVLGIGMGFVLGFIIIFVFFYAELIQKNKSSQKKSRRLLNFKF